MVSRVGSIAGFEGNVTEPEGVAVDAGIAVFAWSHKEEEGDPHEVDEG